VGSEQIGMQVTAIISHVFGVGISKLTERFGGYPATAGEYAWETHAAGVEVIVRIPVVERSLVAW